MNVLPTTLRCWMMGLLPAKVGLLNGRKKNSLSSTLFYSSLGEEETASFGHLGWVGSLAFFVVGQDGVVRFGSGIQYAPMRSIIVLILLTAHCTVWASETSPAGPTGQSQVDTTNAGLSLPGNFPAALSSTNEMDNLNDKHRLAIGDLLSFRILEDLNDPTQVVVTDSGDLDVPFLGSVPAQSKTCRQLAREVKSALEKKYYYHATVIITIDKMALNRGRVYLAGPLRLPGPQDIPSDEILTLSKAILRAGGLNELADGHKVKVIRKGGNDPSGKTTFVVDVRRIFDEGKVELDLPLEPDDLIVVPLRSLRF
jgi:polysaccharide export outer membrane protein